MLILARALVCCALIAAIVTLVATGSPWWAALFILFLIGFGSNT